MKHFSRTSSIALSLLLQLTSTAFAQQRTSSPTIPRTLTGQHLSFLENRGQWDARAKYLLQSGNMNLWITDSGIVYDIYDVAHSVSLERRMRCSREEFRDLKDTITRTGHIVRMSFQNALHSTIAASDTQPGTTNWFIGNDSTKWVTGARTFGRVTIPELYHGVDLVFYLDHGTPRYDLVLKPGADLKQIAMKFEGQDALLKSGADGLRIKTSIGDIEERGLYAYQIIDGQRKQIGCAFELADNGSASFQLGTYDCAQPVIIDPLLYSTCLGGNKDEVVQGMGLTVDKNGSAYATGGTYSSGVYPTGYPTTAGAYQTSNMGASDIFVTKLNPSGSALVYSTYLGGSANDWSMGITVDAIGNAFVLGFTSSYKDFPTTSGSYSPKYRASTTVTKLNATGTALIYSTYLKADESNGIAIDSAGNAYIAGKTTELDPTAGAFQKTLHSRFDAFVSKLSASGSELLYSTYLGGDSDDAATGVAVSPSGEAFVTGFTQSSSFPTTAGAFQTTYANSTDAFVTKLNAEGSALIYSTYIGGANLDEANGIAIDALGNAFIGGQAGVGFPTTAGAFLTSNDGGFKPIITKLNASGNKLIYSTYLTGSPSEERAFVGGIAIDAFGNAYVTGTQNVGMVTTSDAFQSQLFQRNDAMLVKLNASGSQVLYATYLGGGDIDEGECIAVDPMGNAYIGGFTTSLGTPPLGFPTTKGAYQPVNHGDKGDAFVAKFSFSIPRLSVVADSVAAPYCGTTSVLCMLANASGGVVTVDSVSVNDPFTPALGQFPLSLQDKTSGQITIKFLPLIGGAFSQPMTIHFRTPDGSAHDTTIILTASSASGYGEIALTKSAGSKTVAPLSIVNLPVNTTLSNARSIDTMQVDEINFSVAFDSNLLSMDPSKLTNTITAPNGLVFGSALFLPGALYVRLVNPSHTKLSNQLSLGQLLFTAYRGAARSTIVQLSSLTLTVKGKLYSYCTSVEGDFIAVVAVEGSAVSLTPDGTRIRIFPNPASKSDLNIEIISATSCKIEASLLDILGKEVGSIPAQWSHSGANVFQIPTSGLAAGSYYLRTLTNGIAETKKIVIR